MKAGYTIGQVLQRDVRELGYFDIEVWEGTRWMSLESEGLTVAADSLPAARQGRRYVSAQSAIYDGEWVVHSNLSNVTEQLNFYVETPYQNALDVWLLDVQEVFSQPYYQVRISRGDSVEVWNCFPAEWAIDRGHVYSHNIMAKVSLSIPRLPRVIYEVRP